MEDKKLVLEFEKFELRTNSLYKIVDKYDEEALSGFKELGVTKVPSEGIGNTVQCRFIPNPNNPTEGTWDTGFYNQSPRYSGKDEKEIEASVKRLKELVETPYLRLHGLDSIHHNNNDFWNNTKVFLTSGRVFNTSKPQDLFELYLALTNYALTPQGRYTEGSPKFSNSDYLVVDEHKTTEFKKDKEAELTDAILNFGLLLRDSKIKLLKLLKFNGLTINENISDKVLKATFMEYLKSNPTNPKIFNDRIEDLEDSKFEEKINIYSVLSDKYKKGTSVTRKANGRFYYKDLEIGEDLRQAADNLVNSEDEAFIEVKQEIFG